jgi:hypothetical protein
MVMEPVEEEGASPPMRLRGTKTLAKPQTQDHSSQAVKPRMPGKGIPHTLAEGSENEEGQAHVLSSNLERRPGSIVVFPLTPLPTLGSYRTLFDEEALCNAEAQELENDPEADLEDNEEEEERYGFGQPQSPFDPRPDPPSTHVSSDEEDSSRQAKRDAKGKGRAIIHSEDEELEDELANEPDDGLDEGSDDQSDDAPGEKPLH